MTYRLPTKALHTQKHDNASVNAMNGDMSTKWQRMRHFCVMEEILLMLDLDDIYNMSRIWCTTIPFQRQQRKSFYKGEGSNIMFINQSVMHMCVCMCLHACLQVHTCVCVCALACVCVRFYKMIYFTLPFYSWYWHVFSLLDSWPYIVFLCNCCCKNSKKCSCKKSYIVKWNGCWSNMII